MHISTTIDLHPFLGSSGTGTRTPPRSRGRQPVMRGLRPASCHLQPRVRPTSSLRRALPALELGSPLRPCHVPVSPQQVGPVALRRSHRGPPNSQRRVTGRLLPRLPARAELLCAAHYED